MWIVQPSDQHSTFLVHYLALFLVLNLTLALALEFLVLNLTLALFLFLVLVLDDWQSHDPKHLRKSTTHAIFDWIPDCYHYADLGDVDDDEVGVGGFVDGVIVGCEYRHCSVDENYVCI